MTHFDFHVHTALSACADNLLSPGRIVRKARETGVDFVAVTDHNASAHAAVAVRLAADCGLHILPGMEVNSREEVHLLALFSELEALEDFQALIDSVLPVGENPTGFFGPQVIYDERDEIVAMDERMRQMGVSLGLDVLVEEIRGRGGYAVPAHVYRSRNSLTSQLGFVPEAAGYAALDFAARTWRSEGLAAGQRVHGYPATTGSDSHFLEDVGRHFCTISRSVGTVHELFGALAEVAP